MGGFFGVASKENCTLDLFFGTDYHSHLGTRCAGMAVHGEAGFNRAIHNISNAPFRTKFEKDVDELFGNLGIGCISDTDPQPLLVKSHLGSFAITTVGKINNEEEIISDAYYSGRTHFLEMSGGKINATEIVVSIINESDTIVEGLLHAQEVIDGSMSMLIMTENGIYASRDKWGRTPISIGRKDDGFCASFESFPYLKLGYTHYKELGAGEIVYITPESCETVSPARKEMKICTFLWVYYGYPPSCYEGLSVEQMRYNCGEKLALRDAAAGDTHPDMAAGVPDSGTPAAIGYSNASHIPFMRPFIKYTPTWPRSFMPTHQSQRNLIARMKLIPVESLIYGKRLLLTDDSIVRGTQLGETTDYLYKSGAKEVHIRPACPPLLFGCKYLNFSRSKNDLDLITRRVILEREGDNAEKMLPEYANPDSENYSEMLKAVEQRLNFTSLRYLRLDDLIDATGIEPCKLCTYCWSGVE